MHVMFTRLYISESEFNNREDVNTVFWKSNFWHIYELAGLGQVTIVLEIGVSGQKFDGSGRIGSLTKMDPWTSLCGRRHGTAAAGSCAAELRLMTLQNALLILALIRALVIS